MNVFGLLDRAQDTFSSYFPHPMRSSRYAIQLLIFALLMTRSSLAVVAAQATKTPPRAGVANISLTDQYGRPFVLAEQIGHPLVLFFGYSHCGDVCPLTLLKLKHAKTVLGISARPLQVIFITVDAERDTPNVLRRFIGTFDPTFIALTGPSDRLARVYAAYHVTHRAVPSGRSANYEVEHTSLLYFIGRDGRLRGFGDWTDSQTIVTESVRDLLASPPATARLSR
jgi:protein SCO1/2